MLATLDSASRASEDSSRLLFHSLHKWVLHRRDAELSKCFWEVDRQTKNNLRSHDLLSSELFEPEACNQAYSLYRERREHSETTSILKTKRDTSRPKDRSAPAKQPFRDQSASGSRFRRDDRNPGRDQQGTSQPPRKAPQQSAPDKRRQRPGAGRGHRKGN